MDTQQLELVLDNGNPWRPLRVSERRRSRAQWWFQQMHRVVDAALDWRPAPPPRPEQGHLKLAA